MATQCAAVGDMVFHGDYGSGRITDISGYGDLRRVRIRFSESGEKTFVASKVKLHSPGGDEVQISVPVNLPIATKQITGANRQSQGKLKAIQTRYKGYHFRSRLEARWAVYFDALGLEWDYEKEGFDLGDGLLYLPDFWLPQVRMWGEVKPEPFSEIELEKIWRLHNQSGYSVLLLVGVPTTAFYWGTSEYDDGEKSHKDYNDYLISMYHGYPISERRFYSCSGVREPEDLRPVQMADSEWIEEFIEEVAEAVIAARSARFEHGESPR